MRISCFWFSQDRLFSRNPTRKPLNLINPRFLQTPLVKPPVFTMHLVCTLLIFFVHENLGWKRLRRANEPLKSEQGLNNFGIRCRAKIVKKCRNYFWHFLTNFDFFLPCAKNVEKCRKYFWHFWTIFGVFWRGPFPLASFAVHRTRWTRLKRFFGVDLGHFSDRFSFWT